jgi:hypothetical protein
MQTLDLAVNIAIIIIALYLIWDFYKAYKPAAGTALKRIVVAFKGAAASLWTGFTVIVSVVVSGLAYVANLVNAPAVANAITTYGSPKIVAAVMIASAVLIEALRRAADKA